MGIVKATKLVCEYIRRDKEENIKEVKRAIDGVDVDIKKGDSAAVLGRNGSGKSILVKHVNGLLLPTEGAVWVEDVDTRDEEHIWDVHKTTDMVFQNPDNQIIDNIVKEDMGFEPENIGVPTEEIWKHVEVSLKVVGMTIYRLQSPNKLSEGQKQGAIVAGVMAARPECTILDRPTVMLDSNGRREVTQTIHELNRIESIAVLPITHYMEEAIEADRIIVTDDGRIVMDGQSRRTFSGMEKLESHGLNVFQVTELAWELKEAGIPLADGILNREELVEQLVPLLR